MYTYLTSFFKRFIGKHEKLDEVERVKSEFLALAAHELRTPLTTIKNAVSLVFNGSAGQINEDQLNFLTIADRNIDRLAVLLNDFFLLSELETGKEALFKTEIDINDVIKASIQVFSDMANKGKVSLKFEPRVGLKKILLDEYKVLHLMHNLISNAIKFTPEGGVVVVSACRDENKDFVRVNVKDTGIGIDKKYFANLFNRFHQIDHALSRKFAGSGLGLAICKKIVELHRGKIWVESEPGRGSNFIFILPIK